jgi:hypothetical protein
LPAASSPKPLAAASERLRGRSASRSVSRSGLAKAPKGHHLSLERPNALAKAPRPLAHESSVLPRLLGVEAAAAYLSVSTWTLRDMVTGKELVPVQLIAAGRPVRRLLFDRADLDRLVEGARPASAL